MKSSWLRNLAVTLSCVLPTALTGCASEDAGSEEVSESAATLGVEIVSCSQAGSSGHDASSNLTLAMGAVTSLVIGVVNGYVTVNGYPCVKSTGVKLVPSMVKKIAITGTAGDDKVVVDNLSGAFGATILSATGGIAIDLLGQAATDTFSLRGSTGADKWTAGRDAGGAVYFEISGDTTADIRLAGAEAINLSTSAGNDTFTAQGGSITATHLAGSTLTTLTPVTTNLTLNAGDGDDVFTGGNGNDVVNGGNGNDTFKASAADGNDTFNGGAGTDKMDYSARSADLVVVMDGTTDSGEALEEDLIGADVEDLLGGGGDDDLTGNTLPNHIYGGLGDDTISGGAAGSCTADIDILDGEGGNDIFAQSDTHDCGDTMNGGAGTDRVDYQLRTENLLITLDGNASDGETGEKDNVKTDVEIVIGGSGDDVITGSANADELHGGPGGDTLNGGAGNDVLTGNSGNDKLNGDTGNDTFDESGVDPEYTVAENKGDDDDIMNGGTHDASGLDTVDYSARTGALTVTICMDSTKLTGPLSGTPTGQCADDDGEVGEEDEIINIKHIIGGTLGDTLMGSTGNDFIEGGAGDDDLFGGAGNDILFGDAGDDTLTGDAGDDYLDGGAATTGDTFDGDNATPADASDGDVCITKTGDTVNRCEL